MLNYWFWLLFCSCVKECTPSYKTDSEVWRGQGASCPYLPFKGSEKKMHVYVCICVCVLHTHTCKERKGNKASGSKYKQLVNLGEGYSEFSAYDFSVSLNL